MTGRWGTVMKVTLAHDPLRVHEVGGPEEAIALMLHRDWGDMFSTAYVSAHRALYALMGGGQDAAAARRLFCIAADAAGNSVLEAREVAPLPVPPRRGPLPRVH